MAAAIKFEPDVFNNALNNKTKTENNIEITFIDFRGSCQKFLVSTCCCKLRSGRSLKSCWCCTSRYLRPGKGFLKYLISTLNKESHCSNFSDNRIKFNAEKINNNMLARSHTVTAGKSAFLTITNLIVNYRYRWHVIFWKGHIGQDNNTEAKVWKRQRGVIEILY